jgi:hypothetical protein
MKCSTGLAFIVAASLTTPGCSSSETDGAAAGEFRRYRALMSQGGMTLPELPEAALASFPSIIRLKAGNSFEVEGGPLAMRGKYRVERDSIFLDQDSDGKKRLAFAGQLLGDTLHLRMIPDYDVGDGSTEATWHLSFARSR